MLPLPRSISSKSSHCPIAVRLAISGLAPALSAETYLLLAWARRPTWIAGTADNTCKSVPCWHALPPVTVNPVTVSFTPALTTAGSPPVNWYVPPPDVRRRHFSIPVVTVPIRVRTVSARVTWKRMPAVQVLVELGAW
jgi:hypothetical protein